MGITQEGKIIAYLVTKNGIQDTTIPVGLNVTVTLLAPVPQGLVLPGPGRCREAIVAKPAHALKPYKGPAHQA